MISLSSTGGGGWQATRPVSCVKWLWRHRQTRRNGNVARLDSSNFPTFSLEIYLFGIYRRTIINIYCLLVTEKSTNPLVKLTKLISQSQPDNRHRLYYSLRDILIHYVCNTHFHWLWRWKFAALKSQRLCHESTDNVTSLETRRSNATKTFWKSVLLEWIRMLITRFVFEWFAGINCIILRSQIPVIPLR